MIMKRFQAVEIIIPAATENTRFNFPDQPQLRTAKINKIELYTIASVTKSPVTGGTLVAIADMQRCFITLYIGNLAVIENCPIVKFNQMIKTDVYVNNPDGINGYEISWTKSYIQFQTLKPTAATDVVVPFGIDYSFAPSDPNNYIEAVDANKL